MRYLKMGGKKKSKNNRHVTRSAPLTVYKSGNSKVVTLPTEFQFKLGDKLMISEIENGVMLKKVAPKGFMSIRALKSIKGKA